MTAVPPERFRRALAGLDGPGFATFVAALWSESGWDTERRGQVVTATRDDETRRLLVLPPRRLARFRSAPTDHEDADEDVDAVVTAREDPDSGSLPRGTPDVAIVDAGELRDRALYALPEFDADALLREHLDVAARETSPTRDRERTPSGDRGSTTTPDRASAARGVSGRVGRALRAPTQAATIGAVALGIAVIVLVAAAGLSGSAFAPSNAFTDRTDDGEATAQDDPSAAAANPDDVSDAGEPSGADSLADGDQSTDGDAPSDGYVPPDSDAPTDASTPAGDESTDEETSDVDDAVYDVEPTCERGPTAVAENVSAALTGGESGRALAVYWSFSIPDHREGTSYRSYVAILSDAFSEVFEADRIELDEPEELADDRNRINATVVETDGNRLEYQYELQEWSEAPYEGCWFVDRFAPV